MFSSYSDYSVCVSYVNVRWIDKNVMFWWDDNGQGNDQALSVKLLS